MTSRPLQPDPAENDLRQIPVWMGKYASARKAALGMILWYGFYLFFCAAMAGLIYAGGFARRGGHTSLVYLCVAGLVLVVAGLICFVICFSIPSWNTRFLTWLIGKIPASEGEATPACPAVATQLNRWYVWSGVALLIGGIQVDLILGFLGYITPKYMQPVSALTTVPFLVLVYFAVRPSGASALILLWPLLYTVHAILIVCDVPPFALPGFWQSNAILISTAGYGLLMAVFMLIYSRFALRRVRRLARVQSPGGSSLEG